jgi:hypothetical protein
MMNIKYALWLGFWGILGTTTGIIIFNKVMRKYKRQSPLVIILALILGVSAVIVPIMAGIDLHKQINLG